MIASACLLLLASSAPAALLQAAGPAPAGAAARSDWQLVNQLEVIVNEDVLTLRQILGRLRRELERRPVSTQEEMTALRMEVLDQQVEHLLMVQRGRDLGFDPEQVQRIVSNHLETQAQGFGGIADLAEILAQRGETGTQRKQSIEDELYALSFEGAITGRSVGPGGRPMRDRYVRPGQLGQAYEQLSLEPAGVRLIGGQVETFVLQQLAIGVEAFGSDEEARRFAEDLREQALAGDDFDALVATFSLALEHERGLTQPLTLEQLRSISPEIAAFCAENPVGAISEVYPFQERGKTIGFHVLRLYEHQSAELPPFQDPGVQERLRRLWMRNNDLVLREEAVRQLFHSSYIWSPQRVRAPERERAGSRASERDPDAPVNADAPVDPDLPADPDAGALEADAAPPADEQP